LSKISGAAYRKAAKEEKSFRPLPEPPVTPSLPALKLFHVPQSRSFRTLWLLNELAVPFELEVMPFSLEVLRSPAYLAVSPLGRVPAVQMDGASIFESGALAQILSTRLAGGHLARLPDHPEWSAWVQWIHYAETAAVHGASLVQQKVFIPDGQKSAAVQNLESKRLLKAMGVLDEHLANQSWVLPSGFSAADTSIGYSVHLAKGFVDLDHLPQVSAYYDRCAARPAFQAASDNRKISA
jgi:glutathione S-transferase